MRSVNSAGLKLIQDFEGLRLSAYDDGVGVWTIGYGHTKGVRPGDRITKEQAEKYLFDDLEDAERAVARLAGVPLTDNQFSALASFVYNVGAGAFQTSTLLSRLNAGDYGSVPAQLKRWNRAGGRVLAGLTRRREAEARLWSTPDAS